MPKTQGPGQQTGNTELDASVSNSVKPTEPDSHKGTLAAERKHPDQVMSVQEAFGLTLEQYEEVFKRLA